MRFASYHHDGVDGFGLIRDDGLVTLGTSRGARHRTLRDAIAAGTLDDLARGAAGVSPDARLEDVRLLPVIPHPDRIVCVGINYADHRSETKNVETEHPVIFTRFASSQTAHDAPLVMPRVSDRFDYEGELAVVIGRGGRYIAESDALSHVAGYACYNDGSVRDFQRHTHQYTPGKNFPETGAFGPWLVTADEIPDPQALTLETRVNGEVRQHASTADMIFPVRTVVAYVSQFLDLLPGDVIATGTPGGVGSRMDPPVWLKDGDVVEVEISKVGLLRNRVARES